VKLAYDDKTGFYESPDATHEVPDAEWAAYLILQDKACDLEERWLRDCALEDEFAALRGVLSDEEIAAIRAVRSGGSPDPVSTPVVPAAPSHRAEPVVPVSVSQAANAKAMREKKCEHRRQVGPDENGVVWCGSCGGKIYGGAGVKGDIHSGNLRPFLEHPRAEQFEGNV
jgi:hypothetical protein